MSEDGTAFEWALALALALDTLEDEEASAARKEECVAFFAERDPRKLPNDGDHVD